jgi:hypothetical protein
MNAIPKLLILAGAVLAAGCVEQTVLVDPVPFDLAACRPNTDEKPGPPTCQKKPDNTVHVNFNGDSVAPPGICVNRGETVRIEVNPAPKRYNSVVVIPKDAASFTNWLVRFNDREIDAVEIKIPDEEKLAGEIFEYLIVDLAEGRCIDPRIHID